MSRLSDLYVKKRALNSRITAGDNAIRNLESKLQSLEYFQGRVSRSQEEFSSVKAQKTSQLNQLNAYKAESAIAKEYHDGMQQSLNGTGGNLVSKTYAVLLANIAAEKNSIHNEITRQRNDVVSARNELVTVNRKINRELQAQKEG